MERLLPLARYIHASDAVGVDGEGLQVGEGTIDFRPLAPFVRNTDLTVTTEIWQGHKYGGEGFYTAIDRLAKIWMADS